MIHYDQIADMIRSCKVVSMKVYDTSDKFIFAISDCATPDACVTALEGYKNIIAAYGRVKIKAATESCAKQSFKDCFNWYVIYAGQVNNAQPANQVQMPGLVTQDVAALMAQVELLKFQLTNEKRIADLEAQLKGKDESSPMSFLPALGLLMDIPPSRFNQMAQLYALNKGGSMAGLQTSQPVTNKVTVAGTNEDKVKKIEGHLASLSKDVPIDKLYLVTEKFAQNPGAIDMILSMMGIDANQPAQGLAGKEDTDKITLNPDNNG